MEMVLWMRQYVSKINSRAFSINSSQLPDRKKSDLRTYSKKGEGE
jgi:hypothetical protein